MNELWTGKLTRLVAFDPDRGAELTAEWYRDSEFSRYYDFPPVHPRDAKRTQERYREHESKSNPNYVRFHIEALEQGRVIGECDLDVTDSNHCEAFVGIGIGERDFWGKGYGSDAMALLLAYGFREMNLHRIALGVFAYNPRAIRSYEKVGFRFEGRMRGLINRGGERHDSITLGILRTEWDALQND
jgi:RimJ/RimL family protein N-acetyltransferase